MKKLMLLTAVCVMALSSCTNTTKKSDVVESGDVKVETEQVAPKKEKTTIVARVKVKEEKVKDFLELTKPLVEATRNEPGCISYELFQSASDPSSFIFYEEYKDDSAFNAHGNSDHFKTFAAGVPELTAEEMKVEQF
jgi:quinol monooxygenase YgiN